MKITEHLNTEKYVAFLDVLGFKEMVYNSDGKLDIYFNTIQTVLNNINEDKPKIEYQLVSDSIILASDITKQDFITLLTAIQTIQAKCAIQNIWLRGAISIGSIYFNRQNNIVIGSGLNTAYLLETQAKYPRVIIDPKIISKGGFGTRELFMQENNSIFSQNLMHQRRIILIHDYRQVISNTENDAFWVSYAERIAIDRIEDIQLVYENIQKELYDGQQHYSKYLWLKNYFTVCLDILSIRDNNEFYRKISEMSQKFQCL